MTKTFNTDKLKKIFDVQADRGWFVFPDVTWSFIDKAVKDAYKAGEKETYKRLSDGRLKLESIASCAIEGIKKSYKQEMKVWHKNEKNGLEKGGGGK